MSWPVLEPTIWKKTNKQTKKPTNECREKMGEKSKLFKKIERESNHIRRLSFCVVVQHPNWISECSAINTVQFFFCCFFSFFCNFFLFLFLFCFLDELIKDCLQTLSLKTDWNIGFSYRSTRLHLRCKTISKVS